MIMKQSKTVVRALSAGTGAAIAATLVLSACGGEQVGDDDNAPEADATEDSATDEAADDEECGEFNLAINPWLGYEVNAAVIAHVAERELGCTVNKKDLKEEVAWQGFGSGEVDAIVENWGHEDLKQTYIEEQQTAVEAGSTGVEGVIGWYVPPWMVDEYPDITDWENLNDYADLFKTSESGDKGQLLDGDPSYVTNDEALVKNLDLDFKVVQGGSESALIESFRRAEENQEPLLAYFWTPHWLFSELGLVKVDLPAYTEGCDADPEAVACDYPLYDLDKIVSKEFADEAGPAYRLVNNFAWTNDDQNQIALWVTEDEMSVEEAAAKWVEENPDKVEAWLQ
jgi:glycine betaine/proline transport system substrate-binding protein